MRSRRAFLALAVLALSALFCSFAPGTPTPPPPTEDVAAIVQATLAAAMTQTAQAPATAAPTAVSGSSIAGKLGYPSESIPPLRIYALNQASGVFFKQDTVQGQQSYSLDVEPGAYVVFAYLLGPDGQPGGLSGGFTPAVACGLSVDCSDHSLSPVVVGPAVEVPGIDITDWYAPQGSFPPPPDALGVQEVLPPLGTISGSLSYPSESIPAMRIAFFPLGGGTTAYTDTAPGQNSYSMELPEGQYYVVAYLLGGGLSGGYTQAVPCGLSASCTDHSLIPVGVVTAATQSNINPGDWYAPEGTFPPMPGP